MTSENSGETPPFTVGMATVLPDRNLILLEGEETRLEPRQMAVLVRLRAEAGGVVSREALLDDVWGENAPSDEALTQAISRLRRAIGDDPKNPQHIETVPKKGYRLIAAETSAPAPEDIPEVAAMAASSTIPQTRFLWAAIVVLAVGLAATGYAAFSKKERRMEIIEIIELE